MLALLSAWLGLVSFACAIAIVIWRPLFTDPIVTVAIYAGIFALTFAGLTLWDLRKQAADAPGVQSRRYQAYVGTALALGGVTIIYALVAHAEVVPRL